MIGPVSNQGSTRSEWQLIERQQSGLLEVRTAAQFRALVAKQGLQQAYAATDVVVAADAGFTDQVSAQLSLGPTDPPIRLRQAQVDGLEALCGSGSGELLLPAASLPSLATLVAGGRIELSALGEATAAHPHRDLQASLSLDQIGGGRLLLHRAIVENGIVALSSVAGLTATHLGPLVGPLSSALYACGGPGSIGLTMPGLGLLGPGSPVLVAGAVGWVVGPGSGHQPAVPRSPLGHALAPGASAAVSVDLHQLRPGSLRACRFEGHGAALLLPVAAAVPLLNLTTARQAAAGAELLEAPVLDLGIPRRLKPSLGRVRYSELLSGQLSLRGRPISCSPAHSPRLAQAAAEELVGLLREGRFPLRLPWRPLGSRATLVPLTD